MSLIYSLKEKTDTWTIITCQANKTEEDFCSWLLFEQGTLGLEISDINEQILFIKAFFHPADLSNEKIDDLHSKLSQAGLQSVSNTLKVENLANQDWLTNWKIHFKPFHAGDSFLICPPWSTRELKEIDTIRLKTIIIDPGMAFGTGLHATTKFCLHAIEKHLKGPKIIDIGTGSGILSIASTLVLPSANIVAIDYDENAIENAKHNFELNHANKKIELIKTTIEAYPAPEAAFNTILSNMTAEAIIKLMPIYNKIIASKGILILAGIIEERLNLIENTMAHYSFTPLEKQIEDGWVGLVFVEG